MSAIASAFVLSASNLTALRAAAAPVPRFLRKPLDRFPEFLAAHSRELPPFNGSGFLFTTVLAFLGERGLGHFASEHNALAEHLQHQRGALLYVFLTPEHRAAALPKLNELRASPSELERYHEALHEHPELGIGEALVRAIEYLRGALEAVPADGVVLFSVK
jgi:hypothetical protein